MSTCVILDRAWPISCVDTVLAGPARTLYDRTFFTYRIVRFLPPSAWRSRTLYAERWFGRIYDRTLTDYGFLFISLSYRTPISITIGISYLDLLVLRLLPLL